MINLNKLIVITFYIFQLIEQPIFCQNQISDTTYYDDDTYSVTKLNSSTREITYQYFSGDTLFNFQKRLNGILIEQRQYHNNILIYEYTVTEDKACRKEFYSSGNPKSFQLFVILIEDDSNFFEAPIQHHLKLTENGDTLEYTKYPDNYTLKQLIILGDPIPIIHFKNDFYENGLPYSKYQFIYSKVGDPSYFGWQYGFNIDQSIWFRHYYSEINGRIIKKFTNLHGYNEEELTFRSYNETNYDDGKAIEVITKEKYERFFYYENDSLSSYLFSSLRFASKEKNLDIDQLRIYYYENGAIKSKEICKYGKIIILNYNQQGTLTSKVILDKEGNEIKRIYYFPNGFIESKEKENKTFTYYESGKKHTIDKKYRFVKFDENGKRVEKINGR